MVFDRHGQAVEPPTWDIIAPPFTLRATVNGLTRRGFWQLSLTEISPIAGESAEDYRLRILNRRINYMNKNEWVVNGRVSQMAVAHVGIKNALGAAFIIIISASFFAIWRLLSG